MEILSAIYIERLHRFVFDNYYVQNYYIRWTDKVVLWFYYKCCRLCPEWRIILKEYFGSGNKYDRYLHSYFKSYKSYKSHKYGNNY